MRDSRYRHPANALAELIDNSIDARARRVDLLVKETEKLVNTRKRWRIDQIAVFDNGHGMSSQTLTQALAVRQTPSRHNRSTESESMDSDCLHPQFLSAGEWMYGRGRMTSTRLFIPILM